MVTPFVRTVVGSVEPVAMIDDRVIGVVQGHVPATRSDMEDT